jgi:hypothetical protein
MQRAAAETQHLQRNTVALPSQLYDSWLQSFFEVATTRLAQAVANHLFNFAT